MDPTIAPNTLLGYIAAIAFGGVSAYLIKTGYLVKIGELEATNAPGTAHLRRVWPGALFAAFSLVIGAMTLVGASPRPASNEAQIEASEATTEVSSDGAGEEKPPPHDSSSPKEVTRPVSPDVAAASRATSAPVTSGAAAPQISRSRVRGRPACPAAKTATGSWALASLATRTHRRDRYYAEPLSIHDLLGLAAHHIAHPQRGFPGRILGGLSVTPCGTSGLDPRGG